MLEHAAQTPISIRSQSEKNWTFLIQHLPISLAVRELMRLQALSEMGGLQKPILDVGCGDGLFWESVIRSDEKESIDLSGLLGLDVSANELNLASLRLHDHGGQVLSGDICSNCPLGPNGHQRFRTVMANCSLEHVSKIESALRNIHGLMDDNGRFLLFVPVPRWTDTLWVKRICDRVSHRLGGLVAGCLDGFFQHNHLYPAEVWRFVLGGTGFKVDEVLGIGSQAANSVFERYLPTAFLSFLFKVVLQRYPKSRVRFKPSPVMDRFLNDIHSGQVISRDLANPHLVEYFIVCRKVPTTS